MHLWQVLSEYRQTVLTHCQYWSSVNSEAGRHCGFCWHWSTSYRVYNQGDIYKWQSCIVWPLWGLLLIDWGQTAVNSGRSQTQSSGCCRILRASERWSGCSCHWCTLCRAGAHVLEVLELTLCRQHLALEL